MEVKSPSQQLGELNCSGKLYSHMENTTSAVLEFSLITVSHKVLIVRRIQTLPVTPVKNQQLLMESSWSEDER